MLAVSRSTVDIASFVADGMWTPPATLRSLGLPEMAQAAVSSFRGRSHQWVRLYTQGASEDEQNRYADMMDNDIDWLYLAELAPSFMALDLVREGVQVRAPTLYLDPAVELVGLAGMGESFKRFVPHAELDYLELWPGQLHHRQSGSEFARKVTAFIARQEA
jgi:hypothetical protein